MASAIDKNIQQIEKAIEDARLAARSLKSFTFQGTTYNSERIISDLLPVLNTRLENAQKQKTAASEKGASVGRLAERERKTTENVRKRIEGRIKDLEGALPDYFENVANGTMTMDMYRSKVKELENLQADLAKINAGASAVAEGADGYRITSGTSQEQTMATTASREQAQGVFEGAGDVARREMTTPTPVSSETKIINGETVRVDTLPNGTVVTSKDITSPSNTANIPSGTSGTGGTGKTGGKGKGGAGVSATAEKGIGKPVSSNWEPKFREMFPAKVWLLDLDRSKYPKLFALIQKAMDEKYYESAEGKARFEEELKGTDFYQELAVSGKARVVKSLVGDLGFDSTDFSKFLSDAINYGWDNDTLKQKTYEEVFRRNPDGTLANPTALARARKSNDYLNVQLIATRYFNKASDSTIESVLTGRITTEDFQRQQREIAKSKYSHLAPLIDQGVTLDDLASNFKTSAARLLEVDPETIDMGSADYEIALSYGEEGKKRVMTTGEWERLLRTDSRYGWEKTENAKAEARSLASNIAQAFGRII